MTLSEELTWRGFVNQMTFGDITDVNEPRTFYFGVDPSADSMQVGNLAAAMMCRHFIDHGHKAILLVGGATGMIGDPDGKKQERDLITTDEINKNKAAIAAQYKTVFDGQSFEVVDNYDWFKGINYLDFLRNVGKHMSMTQMLDRDFVSTRIGEGGSGISYAEFSYSLIQGYDFLHLYREKGATLQVCGADQWGNSVTGAHLIRRLEGGDAHVYSTPLVVNNTTGVKFGKSEDGAVWLDPSRTSPYQFYQFWLNVDDAGVIDYLKIFTLLGKDDIEMLEQDAHNNPGARSAQKRLAHEVTTLVHGAEKTAAVERATAVLFSRGEVSLSQEEAQLLVNEMPVVKSGTMLIDALQSTELVSSRGEATRLLSSGAISLNGVKVNEDQALESNALIKKGKNTFILIR